VSELIISVSGLRGVVGESLTPEIAVRYACALAAELPAGSLVITRDGRTSGPMLADALSSGLTMAGREVIDAGVAATPTTGVLVRELGAAGGVQISASHNPPQYNGLKLFSAAGRVIPEAAGAKVVERYRRGQPPRPCIAIHRRSPKISVESDLRPPGNPQTLNRHHDLGAMQIDLFENQVLAPRHPRSDHSASSRITFMRSDLPSKPIPGRSGITMWPSWTFTPSGKPP
jgi:hypothetical protein